MHDLFTSALLIQVPEGSQAAPASPSGGQAASSEGGASTEAGSTNGTQSEPSAFTSMLPLLVIGVIFWFLLIGPERKRRKKQQQMITALKKGDEVITTAGLYGEVVQIQDQVVTLKVAEGVRMKFSLQAVQGLVGGEEEPAK